MNTNLKEIREGYLELYTKLPKDIWKDFTLFGKIILFPIAYLICLFFAHAAILFMPIFWLNDKYGILETINDKYGILETIIEKTFVLVKNLLIKRGE